MTYTDALLDTNILLRVTDGDSSSHAAAIQAVGELHQQKVRLYITPQNLIEFWAVASRPKASNGLGLDLLETRRRIEDFQKSFHLAEDTPRVYEEWLALVIAHGVSGKQVHDARLVAVMKAHGINAMLTFNTEDFRRYAGPDLAFLHPDDVADAEE